MNSVEMTLPQIISTGNSLLDGALLGGGWSPGVSLVYAQSSRQLTSILAYLSAQLIPTKQQAFYLNTQDGVEEHKWDLMCKTYEAFLEKMETQDPAQKINILYKSISPEICLHLIKTIQAEGARLVFIDNGGDLGSYPEFHQTLLVWKINRWAIENKISIIMGMPLLKNLSSDNLLDELPRPFLFLPALLQYTSVASQGEGQETCQNRLILHKHGKTVFNIESDGDVLTGLTQ